MRASDYYRGECAIARRKVWRRLHRYSDDARFRVFTAGQSAQNSRRRRPAAYSKEVSVSLILNPQISVQESDRLSVGMLQAIEAWRDRHGRGLWRCMKRLADNRLANRGLNLCRILARLQIVGHRDHRQKNRTESCNGNPLQARAGQMGIATLRTPCGKPPRTKRDGDGQPCEIENEFHGVYGAILRQSRITLAKILLGAAPAARSVGTGVTLSCAQPAPDRLTAAATNPRPQRTETPSRSRHSS